MFAEWLFAYLCVCPLPLCLLCLSCGPISLMSGCGIQILPDLIHIQMKPMSYREDPHFLLAPTLGQLELGTSKVPIRTRKWFS